MKTDNPRPWTAGRVSRLFLYVMTALIAVVFLLFYFVGYDAPAMWDERYNSPVLTDFVMFLIIILFVGACVAVVYSAHHTIRKVHSPAVINGIHGRRITWSVAGGVVLLMAVMFFVLPADRLLANGKVYDEELWIRITNMFVASSSLLIFIGISAIVFGVVKNFRKK